jgi:hypothetical protein
MACPGGRRLYARPIRRVNERRRRYRPALRFSVAARTAAAIFAAV